MGEQVDSAMLTGCEEHEEVGSSQVCLSDTVPQVGFGPRTILPTLPHC